MRAGTRRNRYDTLAARRNGRFVLFLFPPFCCSLIFCSLDLQCRRFSLVCLARTFNPPVSPAPTRTLLSRSPSSAFRAHLRPLSCSVTHPLGPLLPAPFSFTLFTRSLCLLFLTVASKGLNLPRFNRREPFSTPGSFCSTGSSGPRDFFFLPLHRGRAPADKWQ